MKKLFLPILAGLTATTLFTGCLAVQLGGGTTNKPQPTSPSTGQQLIDLQHAKEAGAITDAEYQTMKAQILNGNK
jgi:hypothetical protein